MAAAVVSYSNIIQGVESDGRRSVEATVDFDTGDYTANGIPLPLGPVGLKVVNKAYIVASQHVDNKYLQSQFVTSQATVTAAAWVDIQTNGTPKTPLLVIYVAGAVHGASPVAASRQFRIKFVGS